MKALKPCKKYSPNPDAPTACYWCGWDQVPHLVPDENAFETSYWETLYSFESNPKDKD